MEVPKSHSLPINVDLISSYLNHFEPDPNNPWKNLFGSDGLEIPKQCFLSNLHIIEAAFGLPCEELHENFMSHVSSMLLCCTVNRERG